VNPSTLEREFTTVARLSDRSKITIEIPFDPHEVWGTKATHHVHGTVNGMNFRAALEYQDTGWSFTLGRAWLRGCGFGPAVSIHVVVRPEGPQRGDLADDIRAALDAAPLDRRNETTPRRTLLAHSRDDSPPRSPQEGNDPRYHPFVVERTPADTTGQ
jgi:hypothetical protein